jgi:cell division protein FtsX
MQLVGAKRRFILKPFIKEAVILGIIGAFIGLVALFTGWYFFKRNRNSFCTRHQSICLVGSNSSRNGDFNHCN